MSKTRQELFYEIETVARLIINSKYPHHAQIDLSADCLAAILQPEHKLKQTDKENFQEYQDFSKKIRAIAEKKKEELTNLSDNKLADFKIPAHTDKQFWKI